MVIHACLQHIRRDDLSWGYHNWTIPTYEEWCQEFNDECSAFDDRLVETLGMMHYALHYPDRGFRPKDEAQSFRLRRLDVAETVRSALDNQEQERPFSPSVHSKQSEAHSPSVRASIIDAELEIESHHAADTLPRLPCVLSEGPPSTGTSTSSLNLTPPATSSEIVVSSFIRPRDDSSDRLASDEESANNRPSSGGSLSHPHTEGGVAR